VAETKRVIEAVAKAWQPKIGLLYGCGLRVSRVAPMKDDTQG